MQILQSLETEISMVDQRCNILQENAEPLVQSIRAFLAFQQVCDQPLFIDYVLAHDHRVFLQLVNVQKEILVDVFPLVDAFAELGYFLGHQLYHVRIKIDTLIHDAGKDRVAAHVTLRHGHDPSLKLREATQRHVPERCHAVIHESEGHGLHRVVLWSRHKEVGVSEYRPLVLGETRRALDFLCLSPALDD